MPFSTKSWYYSSSACAAWAGSNIYCGVYECNILMLIVVVYEVYILIVIAYTVNHKQVQ